MTIAQIVKATGGKVKEKISAEELNRPIAGVSTDTRTITKGYVFIALRGDNFDGHDFVHVAANASAACAIVDHALTLPVTQTPIIQIVVKDTLTALGDIAKWWRKQNKHIPIIVIIGSCGKTTTKEMLLKIFEENYSTLGTKGNQNNLIGAPLALICLRPDHEVAVLELGMNMPGELKRLVEITHPNIVVLTNIKDSHIGNFASLEELYHAKCEALAYAPSSATLIINDDDELSCRAVKEFGQGRHIIRFGLGETAIVRAENITPVTPYGYCFDLTLPTSAKHPVLLKHFGRGHIYNALAAAAAASFIGMSGAEISMRLSSFIAGAIRCEVEDMPNGWFCIKDYYNASPAATENVLLSMKDFNTGGKRYAMLGDMLELGAQEAQYHRHIGEVAAQCGVAHLHLLGERAAYIAEGAKAAGLTNVTLHKTPEEAANALYDELRPNDLLLIKASRLMYLENVYNLLKQKTINEDRPKG